MWNQITKRGFPGIVMVALALVALLVARGVNALVSVVVAVDEKQLAQAPLLSRATPAPTVSARVASADPILDHNPFDHTLTNLHPPPEITEEGDGAENTDPMSAPPCDGVKVLVIVASSDPDWSMAIMTSGSDSKSQMRRRGGEVGGKKVKFVGWDRVWLESGSSLCQAMLFKTPEGAAPAKPAEAAPAPAPPSKGGAGAVDPAIAKGIVRVSANEFNIDRGVVDKILENQADLMRQARIVPEQENGKVVGIRMFGVRPETLLGTLGMENGDRLQTINGFDMASPEKALEAYARLRTADKLTVSLNRRGQQMNIDYNIK